MKGRLRNSRLRLAVFIVRVRGAIVRVEDDRVAASEDVEKRQELGLERVKGSVDSFFELSPVFCSVAVA